MTWAAEQVVPRDIVRVVRSRMAAGLRSPTPLLPTDTALCHFLTLIDGVEYIAYKTMAAAIGEQRGNSQEPVNWSNPDEWIVQQLEGTPQALARRLWHDSQRTLNPVTHAAAGTWPPNTISSCATAVTSSRAHITFQSDRDSQHK